MPPNLPQPRPRDKTVHSAAAFEVLRRYSSHKNVKLRDVAEHVVRAGELPDRPLAPAVKLPD